MINKITDSSYSIQDRLTFTARSKKAYRFALDFINVNRVASLATVDPLGSPDISIVYCIADPDLSIYFATRVESRKFEQLLSKPVVAAAFHNENTLEIIRLYGTTERVNDLTLEQRVLTDITRSLYGTNHWYQQPLELYENKKTREIAVIKINPYYMIFFNFKNQVNSEPLFQKII